jgi:hypothetical protein
MYPNLANICIGWSSKKIGQTKGNDIDISPSPISNPHQRTRVHLQSPLQSVSINSKSEFEPRSWYYLSTLYRFHVILKLYYGLWVILSDTFSKMSVISWPSVLLVEETRVPEENHRHVASRLKCEMFKDDDNDDEQQLMTIHNTLEEGWWSLLCTRPIHWGGWLISWLCE